jgi:hypothetical protein
MRSQTYVIWAKENATKGPVYDLKALHPVASQVKVETN